MWALASLLVVAAHVCGLALRAHVMAQAAGESQTAWYWDAATWSEILRMPYGLGNAGEATLKAYAALAGIAASTGLVAVYQKLARCLRARRMPASLRNLEKEALVGPT